MSETITAAEFKNLSQKPKSNKYRAKRVEFDGLKFDSKKELRRYQHLSLLFNTGKISKLERQVRYKIEINGHLICSYVADFVVTYPNGNVVVEDVKGMILPIFKIKQKLMKAVLDIDVIIR